MSDAGILLALGDRALSEGSARACEAAEIEVNAMRKAWAEEDASHEAAATFAIQALATALSKWPITQKRR